MSNPDLSKHEGDEPQPPYAGASAPDDGSLDGGTQDSGTQAAETLSADEQRLHDGSSVPQPGFQAPDYQKEYQETGFEPQGEAPEVYAQEQAYPPQQSYPQQGYPPQQAYPQQGYPPQQAYPPQQSYAAPGAPGHPPAGPPPDNYLVWAILATLFCFWPTGIVAIVNAANVNSRWQMGDVQGAMRASESAKKWSMWTAIIAAIVLVVVVVFYVVVAVLVGGVALLGSTSTP